MKDYDKHHTDLSNRGNALTSSLAILLKLPDLICMDLFCHYPTYPILDTTRHAPSVSIPLNERSPHLWYHPDATPRQPRQPHCGQTCHTIKPKSTTRRADASITWGASPTNHQEPVSKKMREAKAIKGVRETKAKSSRTEKLERVNRWEAQPSVPYAECLKQKRFRPTTQNSVSIA